MTITMFLIFVLVQIAAFQYGATYVVRLASGLPRDEGNLVPEVRSRVGALHRRVCRGEMLLGGALLAGALLVALVLPLSHGSRKLLMAVVSLTSTAGLIWGYLTTYRALYRIAAELPDPGRRVAGLEPRRLSNYYSPWREILPWGLVALTAGLTVYFARRPDAAVRLSEARAWFRPATQVVLNLALLVLTQVRVRSHTCLALGRKTWMDQKEFLELEEQNRRTEARASYWSRVGIVVLTGVMQARVLGIAPWGPAAEFGIVVVMMLFFARHLQRLARSRRALEEPAGRLPGPAGSNRGTV
jgi:hypothetical protein